jgi:NAD(P)-dependent dehydrogenase (short-subunit alcohol dehydrogenase family)
VGSRESSHSSFLNYMFRLANSLLECWAANVKVPKALLTEAQATFNANPDGGHMITTGSIAVSPPFAPEHCRLVWGVLTRSIKATSQGGSSMPYAVTKAAQLQLVKCLAVSVGPKIRVNTVLPGLLLTEWVRSVLPCDPP